jgi:hypothetical protein
MKILRNYVDQNIVINTETDIQTNAGWEESLQEFETEILKEIVNPIENYETVRYIHAPYTTTNGGLTFQQVDLWFEFYFLSGGTYSTDYTSAGITLHENTQFLTQFSKSFFRIEFYKTPGVVVNNVLTCQPPTRTNRKLVFAKNLPTTLSEKFHLNSVADTIHIPIFHASNYKNREMIYQFWFQDESVLAETNLSGTTTGNTFFMTAKFYNTKDGSIVDFTNDDFCHTYEITEQFDMYYQVDFDYVNHNYMIYRYNGTKGSRIGESGDPILFYEKGGKINCATPTPTPTPTKTPTNGPAVTPTLTPTPTITPTRTSSTPYSQPVDFTLANDCENFGVRVANMTGGHNQFQGTGLYFSAAEATGATFFNISQINNTTGYNASRISGNLFYANGVTMYVAVRDLQNPSNISVKSIVLSNCTPPSPSPPVNPSDLYTNTITLSYISSFQSSKCEAYTNCTWA